MCPTVAHWSLSDRRRLISMVSFTPMDRLSTFVAGSHSLATTRLVTVEGLRQLAQVGAASEHSALLFVNIAAGFSQINLRSESTTSLQCTGCRGPVTELQDGVMVCELFDGVITNV